MKTKQYYVVCKEAFYKDSMGNDFPWTNYIYHNTLPNDIEEPRWNSTLDLGYAEVFKTKEEAEHLANIRSNLQQGNFKTITLAQAITNEIKNEIKKALHLIQAYGNYD